MSSLSMSAIVFGCVFGGALLGIVLRRLLPDHHLSSETKDVVKLGVGLIGTMSALVLGLMVASAKSSFDAQRNGLAQLAGNVVFLDRALAHYGPGAAEVRQTLQDSVADMIERTWPEPGSHDKPAATEGRYEGIYEKIQALEPKTDAQRASQAQALKVATDMSQARWALFAQRGSSVPLLFLIVMACWLGLVFASFTLFAPPNTTVIFTLLLCALVVSSTIFLILELDRPFEGTIRISSEPMQRALAQLGR